MEINVQHIGESLHAQIRVARGLHQDYRLTDTTKRATRQAMANVLSVSIADAILLPMMH